MYEYIEREMTCMTYDALNSTAKGSVNSGGIIETERIADLMKNHPQRKLE